MIRTPTPIRVRSWRMDVSVWQVYDSPSEKGIRKLREFLKPYNMTVARHRRRSPRIMIAILDEKKPVPVNWGQIVDLMFDLLVEHRLYDWDVAWASDSAMRGKYPK